MAPVGYTLLKDVTPNVLVSDTLGALQSHSIGFYQKISDKSIIFRIDFTLKSTLSGNSFINTSVSANHAYTKNASMNGFGLNYVTHNSSRVGFIQVPIPKEHMGRSLYLFTSPMDSTKWALDINYNGLDPNVFFSIGNPIAIENSFWNNAPIITINTPSSSTLYENDTFTVEGQTSDADVGNTVTVRYQVNAETVRSIKAFVSDGKTAESFTKSLIFKSGKLYDGENAITGNLTDGVAHKLKVWATDDQGGTSTIVERDFYVVPNRAPSLTVDAPIISGNIDNDKFTIKGTYHDADGNTTTVKYRINGGNSVQVASGTSGTFDFEVSFAQLVTGPNTIVIEAIDSYGAKTSKTVKLNKNVVSTEQLRSTARYKILPPAKTAQAVLLWIERDKDLDIDVSISMTMAGEAESFVPVIASESVPIAAGSNTYEDTLFYEADSAKENIIVQIDMTRKSVDADDKITLISGVLE